MRDIESYGVEYQKKSFETYQVKYRRKMLLERISYWKKEMGHPLKIFEGGSGADPLFQYVESYEKYVCTEPCKKFAKYANDLKRSNVRVYHGFMEDYIENCEKDTFDIIIISSVLHEVEKPEKLLEAAKKLAGRDTIIHVNVPNANSMHRLLAVEAGLINNKKDFSQRNKALQQNYVFDMDSLMKLLRSVSDIKMESQGTYFVKPFSHGQMQALLDKNIITEEVLDGLYDMSQYLPELGSEIFVEFRFL